MTTRFTFVPIPAELIKKQNGPLGSIDESCWGTVPQEESGPGPWEERVTGPDAQGRYTVERWPLVSRPVAPKSRIERDSLVMEYISSCSGKNLDSVTVRGVEEATGIPHATVGRLTAWRQFVERRESSRKRQIRTRPLDGDMLACISSSADDPAEIAAANEQAVNDELAALIEEQQKEMEIERDSRPFRGRRGKTETD